MGWTMLYLFVFLKLPIVGACYIVWWAIHQTDETTGLDELGEIAQVAIIGSEVEE